MLSSEVRLNSDLQNPYKKVKSISKIGKNGSPSSESDLNPVTLAYFLLLDAATSSADTAIIRSKQLRGNAMAQQRLDSEGSRLQWWNIPQADISVHHIKYDRHTKWFNDGPGNSPGKWAKDHGYNHWTRMSITGGNGWAKSHDKFWKTTVEKTIKNKAQIDQAQAKNQVVSGERETLSGQLKVLQQTAQMGETGVNSQVDDSVQAMQEGANLMSIIQSLTFKALIRRPVQ